MVPFDIWAMNVVMPTTRLAGPKNLRSIVKYHDYFYTIIDKFLKLLII